MMKCDGLFNQQHPVRSALPCRFCGQDMNLVYTDLEGDKFFACSKCWFTDGLSCGFVGKT